jgi:DNA-binding NarL/FixJ family response regulator
MSTPSAIDSKMPAMDIQIAIVDDDAGLRDSFAKAVALFPGCRCIGTFDSGRAALQAFPKDPPDVVLMDINMPGMTGIQCVQQLKQSQPDIQIIMLTVYEDTPNVFDSLIAGASGYLLKQTPWEELQAAIQLVHTGGSPMSSHIAIKVAQAFRQPAPVKNEQAKLSQRERQILELLAKGYLYKEIPAATGITYATVHSHIRRIYEKLQVHSRAQAAAKYFSDTESPVGER